VKSAEYFVDLTVSEAHCLRIPRNYGEKCLALVKKMSLFNREYKVQSEEDYLLVPLTRELLASELLELKRALPEVEICTHRFYERVERQNKLVDLLTGKLPPHVLASLPHAIDFVGDIAVVEIPPELENYKKIFGEAVMMSHKSVRTVLAKSSAVSGVYRLRTFEAIAGEAKTETVHKEFGCIFHVDLAKAYFSPRLSYEHSRVASLVRRGETVVDMFAGVGAFSILIAKKQRDVQVYAIDVNPDAFEFLKKNVAVNRAGSAVTPILGDAKEIVNSKLTGIADRVIMNLPETAIEYVDVACRTIKPEGGVIHYYEFSNSSQPIETAISRLTEAVKQSSRRVEKVLAARIVRGVAPFTYQVGIDAEIR
jgi:tRNA (guanine37-N1)-methyltransferase